MSWKNMSHMDGFNAGNKWVWDTRQKVINWLQRLFGRKEK
jgi:hypothetical protein